MSQLWKEVTGFLYRCNTLITTHQIPAIPSSDRFLQSHSVYVVYKIFQTHIICDLKSVHFVHLWNVINNEIAFFYIESCNKPAFDCRWWNWIASWRSLLPICYSLTSKSSFFIWRGTWTHSLHSKSYTGSTLEVWSRGKGSFHCYFSFGFEYTPYSKGLNLHICRVL